MSSRILSAYHPGKHVACISNRKWARSKVTALPEIGKVYTVRDFYRGSPGGPIEAIRLVEMRCEPIDESVYCCQKPCCLGEYWLPVTHFRPLKKLSVKEFTEADTLEPA